MLEILNIRAVNKGSVLGICDVHIIPWKLTMKDVVIFQKGNNRWVNLPSKEYQGDMGEKKYTEMLVFDNEAVKNRFRNQIMEAVDKYLNSNPDMKPEDVIKDEELPF